MIRKGSIAVITMGSATTVAQLRAARALLGWSQVKLAQAAGVSEPTVKRIEGQRPELPSTGSERSWEAIRAALEAAGVIFVDENGEGPGVRLRKAK